MSNNFTVEEINMICIFDTSDKNALIAELTAAMPEFIEPGFDEIAENVLVKLEKMTDEEFAELELYPEYNDYESEVQPDGD